MLTTESTIERNVIASEYFCAKPTPCPLEIASGICVAGVVTAAPFFAFYSLSQSAGLTAFNYPAIANVASVLGIITCLLSLPVVNDLKKHSGASLAVASAIVFSVLGFVASLAI